MSFHDPLYLLLFIPLTLGVGIALFRRNRAAVRFSSVRHVGFRRGILAALYPYLVVLRIAGLSLLIIALARPGEGVNHTEVLRYGVDIVMALDVSPSMRGMDFEPSRLDVAKRVIRDFAAGRTHDRLGMVIFAGKAYLQAPLTADKNIITEIINEIDFDSVETDGTAIGEAIMLACARLKSSTAQSRAILLVTDGVNNRGVIDPATAAEAAASLGIKVYAIGVGRDGAVPYPTGNPFFPTRNMTNQFDETALRMIADKTGGKFYRASDEGFLERSIREVDALERSKYNIRQYYEFSDWFMKPLSVAALLLLIELFMRAVIFRRIP
jgi:Ca-activated chloride channel homolog